MVLGNLFLWQRTSLLLSAATHRSRGLWVSLPGTNPNFHPVTALNGHFAAQTTASGGNQPTLVRIAGSPEAMSDVAEDSVE